MTETQAAPDTRRWWALALIDVAEFTMAALVAALVAVPLVPASKPPAGMAAHAH